MPGRSGTRIKPSVISIGSLNKAENQGMCSTEMQLASEAAKQILCSVKIWVETGTSKLAAHDTEAYETYFHCDIFDVENVLLRQLANLVKRI